MDPQDSGLPYALPSHPAPLPESPLYHSSPALLPYRFEPGDTPRGTVRSRASTPFPPPPGMLEVFESALRSVVETSQTHLQQALSAINNATAALLKVSFNIGTAEQLINSAAVPFTGDYKVVYDHLVSEYLQTLQNLDIKDVWAGVGQAWGMFRGKMPGLESEVDALKKKCSSGFIAQVLSSTATINFSSGA